jgi:hypothetical protein
MLISVCVECLRTLQSQFEQGMIVYDISWQRNLCWPLKMKRKLIKSLKERMPFGTLTFIIKEGKMFVLDGKQRFSTMISFINNEFKDEDGLLFEEWDARDQRGFCRDNSVAIQKVVLEENENHAHEVKLFQMLNTQGKRLSDGELIACCEYTPIVKLAKDIFLAENPKTAVEEIRKKWTKVFNPDKENRNTIKRLNNKGEMTFFVPFVLSGCTSNLNAISTSFSRLVDHDLDETPKEYEVKLFYKRLHAFMCFVEIEPEAFGRPKNGFPLLGHISAVWAIIIKVIRLDDDLCKSDMCDTLYDDGKFVPLKNFYSNLKKNNELQLEYDTYRRKNRNQSSLTSEIVFIHSHSNST